MTVSSWNSHTCYVSTIQVGTQLNPDANVAVPSKGLPKWVIPVCVVSAVLLLVLIVFCLYKVSEQGITAFHILMIMIVNLVWEYMKEKIKVCDTLHLVYCCLSKLMWPYFLSVCDHMYLFKPVWIWECSSDRDKNFLKFLHFRYRKVLLNFATALILKPCVYKINTVAAIARTSQPFTPYHQYAIFHTVLCTIDKMLTRRMCLTIKSFFSWWSFPWLLRP